jgi:hypothetical protein
MPVGFITTEFKMAKKSAAKTTIKTQEQPPELNMMDLFARKPERGVTIMTKEAASLSDATKPAVVPKGPAKNITTMKKKK